MNWLILLALGTVFALQVSDRIEQQDHARQRLRPDPTRQGAIQAAAGERLENPSQVPDITQEWQLRPGNPKGFLGYMWLHAGLLHLLGNMLFLWIFGNAVCAKVGNLRYLGLYLLFGVLAGMAHRLTSSGSVVGASGAISGMVGMYLALFFENEITCLFVFWFILLLVPYVRWFAVSGIWVILGWLLWNVGGALAARSYVSHAAHFGGFAVGLGVALLMCQKGWITMEKYEKSLLQMWQERRRKPEKDPLDAAYAQLGLQPTEEERHPATAFFASPGGPEGPPASPTPSEPAPIRAEAEGFIRTACACGHVIRLKRQYVGRTVRCPRCRHPVVIPDQTDFFGPAPPLPPVAPSTPKKMRDTCIHFVCTCGKRMKASAQHAGRTVKCPHCGAMLKIPTLTS
jgi:membrane associated rhomboid family serine protease/DNA-directed RNA polymerase subunit RPC12/RpoP